jgi:protein involved in polysaccharide export with SLBB domain
VILWYFADRNQFSEPNIIVRTMVNEFCRNRSVSTSRFSYEKVTRLGFSTFIFLLFVLWVLAASAQDQPPSSSVEPSSGLSQADDATATLIRIFQDNPSLLASAKQDVADILSSRGQKVTADSLSDDEFFRVVQGDPSISRSLLKKFPEFLPQSQPLPLVGPGGQKSQPIFTAEPPLGGQRRGTGSPYPENPQISLPNPYTDIPSLKDLYKQLPEFEGPVERFGMTIFNVTSTAGEGAVSDGSTGVDYALGPGDLLDVNVSGGASWRVSRLVDREGRISLPDLGPVAVAGKTVADAQQSIQKAFGQEFRELRVDLSIARLRTTRVYVVGDVRKPGAYTVSGNSTALGVLVAAGGPTSSGSLRKLRHFRGSKLVGEIDLYEFLLSGVSTQLQPFANGDTLLVPPIGRQITVVGAIRRPGIYELRDEDTLDQALTMAGGVPVGGTLSEIVIDRVQPHTSRRTVTFQIEERDSVSAEKQLRSFLIQDGDRVTVSSILPNRLMTVYLDGHVFYPGRRGFKEAMTVSDLIPSADALLPEPSDRAEIIRLKPPYYRPIVLPFSLSDVLEKHVSIVLTPLDTVRIYGRYDRDSPKVTILGEVMRPGEYPLALNMTASDLVRLAGGFTLSAYREDAIVSSYVVQNGRSVQIQVDKVELRRIAEGDSGADLVLKPGDSVSIRQMSGWKDIGASVTLTGEVQFPGAYGITPGERLSSVIHRAGGFLPEAYPRAAVFERRQIRDLNDQARLAIIRKIEITPSPVKVSETTGQNSELAFEEKKKEMLVALKSQPASGRLVIRITADFSEWENTPSDLQLRAGDSLSIPKQPGFVMVTGQVNNGTALIYTPGRSVGAYLQMAGGSTRSADTKELYVIQASGRVIGKDGGHTFRSVQDVLVSPGDTIVVPEKLVVESQTWKNVLSTAQFITSLAIAAAAVHSF